MRRLTAESPLETPSLSVKMGIQLLMLFLFLYFSYSGASELGVLPGIPTKFKGHAWLARIMGMTELLGGLALLSPEGVFGGACFLIVAMTCALVSTFVHREPYAAVECLFFLNVCVFIAYWRRPKG
jgi:hypothetical protein